MPCRLPRLLRARARRVHARRCAGLRAGARCRPSLACQAILGNGLAAAHPAQLRSCCACDSYVGYVARVTTSGVPLEVLWRGHDALPGGGWCRRWRLGLRAKRRHVRGGTIRSYFCGHRHYTSPTPPSSACHTRTRRLAAPARASTSARAPVLCLPARDWVPSQVTAPCDSASHIFNEALVPVIQICKVKAV